MMVEDDTDIIFHSQTLRPKVINGRFKCSTDEPKN